MSSTDVPTPNVKGIFMAWCRRTNSATATGSDRADGAALRRCHDLLAVACTPGYQRLYRAMLSAHDGPEWRPFEKERLAAIVALAAHLQGTSDRSLPDAFSYRPPEQDSNPVSPLRFRRLLDSPDIESLFTGLRRTLPLIEHQTHPGRLFDDILQWGEHKKKQWAYEYRWPSRADN
jgi:CRISPR system Cascade subunit CasB